MTSEKVVLILIGIVGTIAVITDWLVNLRGKV